MVPDARVDPRFADNPFVTGMPEIRFYAGAPLQTPGGQAVGTLCTVDTKPRGLTPEQIQGLQALSRQVVAQMELRRNVKQLSQTLEKLQRTQASLIQTEKMSALGRFVAGIAHEINNPVSFILGNLPHAQSYTEELLELLHLYQAAYPQPKSPVAVKLDDLDLDYIAEDFFKLLNSIKFGAIRIEKIVKSLRTFSNLHEADIKSVQLREHLDNALDLSLSQLQDSLNPFKIEIIKHYQDLPPLVCNIAELNQVLISLISNAMDALQERVEQTPDESSSSDYQPTLTLTTDQATDETGRDFITLTIEDNGIGIELDKQDKIFDPFYSSKPVGKGTGLGLTSSYEIVVKQHQGKLLLNSTPGQGSRFSIWLPTDLPLPD